MSQLDEEAMSPPSSADGHDRANLATNGPTNPPDAELVAMSEQPVAALPSANGDEPIAALPSANGDEPTVAPPSPNGDEPIATLPGMNGDEPVATMPGMNGDEPTVALPSPNGDEPIATSSSPNGDGPDELTTVATDAMLTPLTQTSNLKSQTSTPHSVSDHLHATSMPALRPRPPYVTVPPLALKPLTVRSHAAANAVAVAADLPTTADVDVASAPVAAASSEVVVEEVEPAVIANPLLGWAVWGVRAALVAVAVILAIISQNTLVTDRTTGLPFPPNIWNAFAVGALLLAVGSWAAPRLLTAVPAPFRSYVSGHPHWKLALPLLVLALICSGVSIPLFRQINDAGDPLTPGLIPQLVANGAWLLFLASLALFGAALIVWQWGSSRGGPALSADPLPDLLPRGVEIAIVAVLFLAALLVRFIGLDSAPPGLWFDEAQNGIVARTITGWDSAHPVFISGLTQMGAFYFYILGMVLHFTGNSVAALRFLPAFAGAACAPLMYVLASRLYGWRVGLAAGGFLAFSVWNITMSRFGMVSMTTVALDLATVTCLVLALRSGYLAWYGLAGILLGIALQGYYISLVLPVVLGAVFLHKLISERWRFIKGIRWGLPVFLLGALLAFLPMGLFILQHYDLYAQRQTTVSLLKFNGLFAPGGMFTITDPAAFQSSLTLHLQMFNWLGDHNPRHNIPTADPMLDPLMAALFAIGLGYCLLRFVRWQFFLPIVWFVAELSGGVLSLSFEAPQAHRTQENSIVTSLFAGLAIGLAVTALTRSPSLAATPAHEPPDETRAPRTFPRLRLGSPRRRLLWRIAQGAAIVVIVIASVQNGSAAVKRYTNQSQMASTWLEMGAIQENVALQLRQYESQYKFYISPLLIGLPPQQYLAPNVTPPTTFEGGWSVPFPDPAGQNLAVIVERTSVADFARITQLYPHARYDFLCAPTDGMPLEYTAYISSKDLEELRGVRIRFYPADAVPTAAPSSERTQPLINDAWDNPPAGLSFPFRARYDTTVRLPASAPTTFHLEGNPADTTITVDGFPAGQPRMLGNGLHTVSVDTIVRGPSDHTHLLMNVNGADQDMGAEMLHKPSLQPHGLTGYYRQGTDLSIQPSLMRVDPLISFYFHLTPLNRPYTVEWKGKLYAPVAGGYEIGVEQISTATVTIDGQQLLENDGFNQYTGANINLTRGFHDLRVVLKDADGSSHIYLSWLPPGKDRAVIPTDYLWPEQASYPDLNDASLPTLDKNGFSAPTIPASIQQCPPPKPINP